jgi:hypothetical protein
MLPVVRLVIRPDRGRSLRSRSASLLRPFISFQKQTGKKVTFIDEQHRPARQESDQLSRRHRFKVASLKLAFIVPLFLLASWSVYRFRDSAYRPNCFAAVVATF